MKILVRGDLHLGLVSDGLPRLGEQERIAKYTVQVLREVDPDVFVDLGDLFDSPRPGPVETAVAIRYALSVGEWNEDLDHRAYILTGNHDKPTRGRAHALRPLAALRQECDGSSYPRVVDGPTVEVLVRDGKDVLALILLPFVSDWEARQKGVGHKTAQDWVDAETEWIVSATKDLPIVAFSHLEVPGATLAEDDRTKRDVGTRIPDVLLECKRLVRVYAGHVHRFQELEKVTVVGSALHVNFGEAADRKVMILAEV